MPLSEKARVEVYVPDLPVAEYQNLLETLEAEFTYDFGGCTVQRGLNGFYLSNSQHPTQDPIILIYTDTLYSFTQNFSLLSQYADELRERVAEALKEEEEILVAVIPIYHSKQQAPSE